MIQRRRKHLAFGHGNFKWVNSSTPAIASFLRTYGIDRMLCVHNLSSTDQDVIVYLPASEFHTPHRPAVELKGSVGDLPHHSIYDILTDLPSTVSQNGTPSPFAFKYVLIRLQELCI